MPMTDLLSLQKTFIRAHLQPGDRAVDFTMGNGYDTVFLSKTVGPAGSVIAFDIQEDALLSTERNLRANGCPDNWRLICASHHRASEFIHTPIRAGMFNLGWLPGGDKSVTTHWETTHTAIEAAISLLEKGGVCTVCAYPGHEAGDQERFALMDWLQTLRPQEYNVLHHRFLNAGPGAPECFVIQRNPD